jgi:hypothetical protein
MNEQHKLRLTTCILLAAVVLLTGCDEAARKYQTPGYVPSENELTRIAVEWPEGDPLKPTAQAVALERFATAQAHESAAEAAEATRQAEQDSNSHYDQSGYGGTVNSSPSSIKSSNCSQLSKQM